MVVVQNFAISNKFSMIRVCTSGVCTLVIGCSGKENKKTFFPYLQLSENVNSQLSSI